MSPQLELVVPTYNMEPYIGATLASILAQACDLRVHVVDDGSTDRTGEVVRSFLGSGRVTYHEQPHSGCAGVAKNHLLGQLQAPFVGFFDADDLMCPGYLPRHLSLLDAHPDWVGITGDYQNFNVTGLYPTTHFQCCLELLGILPQGSDSVLSLSAEAAKSILTRENFSITGACLLRTAAVKRIGGFAAELLGSEDFDLLWRLLGEGDLGVSKTVCFERRIHDRNSTNNALKMLRWKIISRTRLREAERLPKLRQELAQAIARFWDEYVYAQVPLDPMAGIKGLLQGLPWMARTGHFPRMALTALAKSGLKR